MSARPPDDSAGASWRPPSIEALQSLLPHFEILSFIARGGMGAVYKAVQRSLDRTVAIKILPPEAMEGGGLNQAERFRLEARAMAMLEHPGIVTVHEAGEASGLLYIVMEFVEGSDVAQLVTQHGQLPPDLVLKIVARVCEALAYAHACGVVHRDIKPSNVMVDKDGKVKVADFGLAKMTSHENAGLTGSQTKMGTPDFAAPESLVAGMEVDQRADVYALGVMLYQMLTGKIPRGRYEQPSVIVPALNQRFDVIIDRAMKTDRDRRYSSALELREALESLDLPSSVHHGWRPRLLIGLGVVGVILAAAALVVMKEPDSAPVVALPEAPLDADLTNSLGMKFQAVPGTDVLFCAHETRWRDYAVYAAETPGVDDSWKRLSLEALPWGDPDNHPVRRVSWQDAQEFCAWLSRRECRAYRLPTDREWSYAVGIGAAEKRTRDTWPASLSERLRDQFPWGTKWPRKRETGKYGDQADVEHLRFPPSGYGSFPTTIMVMSYEPNGLGLYDLGGNVWEWCEDWYDATKKERVLRGASERDKTLAKMLSSYRNHVPPASRETDFGFRCVLPRSSAGPITIAVPPLVPPPPPAVPAPPAGLLANSLGMRFVPLPGTKLQICIHETRHKDFAAFDAETHIINRAWEAQVTDGFNLKDQPGDHPVMLVTRQNAQDFCAWLSKKEGKTYRLPTDREWSVAVGIGKLEKRTLETTPEDLRTNTSEAFPWGLGWPRPPYAGNYSDKSRQEHVPVSSGLYFDVYDDGYPTTAPVMRFPPNALGLYDIGGNVWEWCEDWFDREKQLGTLRGGSWHDCHRSNMMSSSRYMITPETLSNCCGFRCVLETAESASAPAP